MSQAEKLICSSTDDLKKKYQIPQQRQDHIFPWANSELLSPFAPKNYLPLPPYFRTTTSIFPDSPDCYKKCQIPLGLLVNPTSLSNVPEIDYSNDQYVPKCSTCSAFLSIESSVIEINGQRSWSCPICGKSNAFQGRCSLFSRDKQFYDNRIELTNPVYDIIAPNSMYTKDSQPCFAFIIDTSYAAYSSGFTHQFLTTLKLSIKSIPDNYRVCLIAMSDTISVFDLIHKREITIPDLIDMEFNENCDKLLPVFSECRESFLSILDLLMQRIPSDHNDGHCYLSSVLIAESILYQTGGLLIIGCVNRPTSGPYALSSRSSNTESDLFQLPQNDFYEIYKEEGFQLNKFGVSVHLFCASYNEFFCDITTMATLCSLTSGHCYFYKDFDESKCHKLHLDLFQTLNDTYFWNSSLRVHYSYGLKLSRVYANCSLKMDNILSFPILGKNDTVALEFIVDKSIVHLKVHFQVCFTFTRSDNQKIFRIINFNIAKSNNPLNVCNAIDEASLMAMITRQVVGMIIHNGSTFALNELRKRIIDMFSKSAKYRSLLFLLHSLLANPILNSTLNIDEKMTNIMRLRSIKTIDLLLFFYPRLFSLTSPICLSQLKRSSLDTGNCFLLHTYNKIYLFIKDTMDSNDMKQLFGNDPIQNHLTMIPTLQTPENEQLHALLNDCYKMSGNFLDFEFIFSGTSKEKEFYDFFVDDKKSLEDLISTLNIYNI